MNRVIISSKGRTRLAAIIGAEIIEPQPMWPKPRAGQKTIIIEQDRVVAPPLIENAAIVVIDELGDLISPPWCAGFVTNVGGDARDIRAVVDLAESVGSPAFRPFEEQWGAIGDRERGCMARACLGMSGQEIADELGLSVRTAQGYMSRARASMDYVHIPRVVGLLLRDGHIDADMTRKKRNGWLARWNTLTSRQDEIAKMAMVMRTPEIAVRANLTRKTVGVHREHILRKLRGSSTPGGYTTVNMALDAAICGVHPEVSS